MRVLEGNSGRNEGEGNAAASAYQFAEFRLLAHHQRLEIDGAAVALTTKLYHLLLIFLTHPGEVVSKEVIVNGVWPGQVVTDAALAKQIQRLRGTLNDSDRDPPLIETHRGRGYRLTCPVTIEHASPEASGLEGRTSVSAANSALMSRAPVIAVFVTVVAVLGFGLGIGQLFSSTAQEDDRKAARRIAVLPLADQSTTLSEGAAEYLATRLGGAVDLAPALLSEEAPEQAVKLGGLELYRLRNAPVIALRLERQNELFRLSINLRTEAGSMETKLEDQSIARLLTQGEDWIRLNAGVESASEPADNPYALSSHFEGLASNGCDSALPYYKAAVTRDPDFTNAQLHLARCEQARGNAREAAATAMAVLNSATVAGGSGVALDAHLIAARAFIELGDATEARAQLESASKLVNNAVSPLQELSSLAVLSLLAAMNEDPKGALELQKRRLDIAKEEYPLPDYLAGIHLDIAELGLITGDYSAMRSQADQARVLAEEHGDLETLMRSYRFLITAYFRAEDMDAAAQLALAARPIIDRTEDVPAKGFFMQFAALALNARGHIQMGREYTEQLRSLSHATANPIFGALADLTVVHRRYAQNDFPRAYTFAASTRARLEREQADHSALPQAMAFEALAAARGAPVEVAQQLIQQMESRYANVEALKGVTLRAKGHLLFRTGKTTEGLSTLRQSEAAMRSIGSSAVADYVGYEIIELRLSMENEPPWDDINRLSNGRQSNYYMSRITAQAHALDGKFLAATSALEEARLLGNELWSSNDQLLLEMYESELTAVSAN